MSKGHLHELDDLIIEKIVSHLYLALGAMTSKQWFTHTDAASESVTKHMLTTLAQFPGRFLTPISTESAALNKVFNTLQPEDAVHGFSALKKGTHLDSVSLIAFSECSKRTHQITQNSIKHLALVESFDRYTSPARDLTTGRLYIKPSLVSIAPKHLQTLAISRGRANAVINASERLHQLRVLDLVDCSFRSGINGPRQSKLHYISAIRSLEQLSIAQATLGKRELDEIPRLSILPKLSHLRLSEIKVDDPHAFEDCALITARVASLPHLQSLDLSNNHWNDVLNDQNMSQLNQLHKLESLNLSGKDMSVHMSTFNTLSSLTALSQLIIRHGVNISTFDAPLTVAASENLLRGQGKDSVTIHTVINSERFLTGLHLSNKLVTCNRKAFAIDTDMSVDQALNALPALQSLDLSHNGLKTKQLVRTLPHVQTLTELKLNHTEIDHSILRDFTQLSQLQRLEVWGCHYIDYNAIDDSTAQRLNIDKPLQIQLLPYTITDTPDPAIQHYARPGIADATSLILN